MMIMNLISLITLNFQKSPTKMVLKKEAEVLVNNQLAMYGIHNLPQEEVQKYAVEMLKQEEQVRQISQEVAMNKLKEVILEKSKKKETKISHDKFLEELKK